MPRRTYDDRKGRRRPSDHRVKYSREQITPPTNTRADNPMRGAQRGGPA
jgi:hypothetical protein